ncbi:MAG: vitamin K epoxide reductase family protein [Gaiellaceae bacterium]
MSERALRAAGVALAAGGAAVCSYLLYVRQSGAVPACATGGCETVQSSAYGELFGLPVAALGLAGYLGLIIAALARGEWARMTQATLALAALVFSAYLLVVQLVVIGALCQWCLLSDTLVSGVALVALLRLRTSLGSAKVA